MLIQAGPCITKPGFRSIASGGHPKLSRKSRYTVVKAGGPAQQTERQSSVLSCQHALLQCRSADDDRLPRLGEGTILFQHRLDSAERADQDIHRGQPLRRPGNRLGQGVAKHLLSVEKRLALVSEVLEECPLRNASSGGDFRRCGRS